MIIQGKYPIIAPTQVVWKHLLDPEVLIRITPGISELHPIGDDTYKAISTLKIGPVNGRFEGQLELRDKVENSATTLVIKQQSKMGNVLAEIKLQLNSAGDTTEIDYKGDAKLSGRLATMGQRIIGGVVSSLSKQFFKALTNEINLKQKS